MTLQCQPCKASTGQVCALTVGNRMGLQYGPSVWSSRAFLMLKHLYLDSIAYTRSLQTGDYCKGESVRFLPGMPRKTPITSPRSLCCQQLPGSAAPADIVGVFHSIPSRTESANHTRKEQASAGSCPWATVWIPPMCTLIQFTAIPSPTWPGL